MTESVVRATERVSGSPVLRPRFGGTIVGFDDFVFEVTGFVLELRRRRLRSTCRGFGSCRRGFGSRE
jgi:hypothetical protein